MILTFCYPQKAIVSFDQFNHRPE